VGHSETSLNPPVLGWPVPILVTALAWLAIGVLGIWFDLGLSYPIAAGIIGSTTRVSFPSADPLSRQLRAAGLAYLAIAFSPLIAFALFVQFDPVRVRNAAVGAAFAFVPIMWKQGVIGIVNVGLLVIALASAWMRSGAVKQPSGHHQQ
jgi:hypothetical protein